MQKSRKKIGQTSGLPMRVGMGVLSLVSILVSGLSDWGIYRSSVVLAQSVPTRSPSPTPVSTPQITNYARAVLEIETLRLRFHQQAGQILRGPIPANTCLGNRRDNIPTGLENICTEYLNAAKLIIDKYQLSPEQFNQITLRSRSDLSLMKQIQEELSRLQQSRPNLNRPTN